MDKIRFATIDDIDELKNIWKVCFGDSDTFINYYFEQEFKADKVLLLLEGKEIASMLTMIPINLCTPKGKKYKGAMLYAIATHPKFQSMGLSTKLMDYSSSYLRKQEVDIVTLVPATMSLINFYAKRGYKVGFYHKEFFFTHKIIQGFSISTNFTLTIKPANPMSYQQVRESILSNCLYQSYDIDGIAYQKRLSLLSLADIYLINDNYKSIGCAIIEKLDNNGLLIKELLVPDDYIESALLSIAALYPSEVYKLRLPVNMGQGLGGEIKSFGMYQLLNPNLSLNLNQVDGYLGIAYD